MKNKKILIGFMVFATIIVFSFAALSLTGCEGPQGPQSPAGDPGETGPQGVAGNPGHLHTYDNGICSECYSIVMVQLPGGTFSMGQTGFSTPVRAVTLSSFTMSKYTVTQELYRAVTRVFPSEFNPSFDEVDMRPAGGEIQYKRPVEMVTWFDAVEFCNKLSEREGFTPVYTITDIDRDSTWRNSIIAATVSADWNANGYRLPTEAEWEYACRAGSTTYWHFGDSEGTDDTGLRGYAWYSANAGDKTHQVGKKLPNAWGLFDMYGNVLEWCWDWGADYVDAPPNNNPVGPAVPVYDYRVLRGGGWDSIFTFTYSAYRGDTASFTPGTPDSRIGFRVVRR